MQTGWQELDLTFAHAQRCALRTFGPEDGLPVLALHGWQDNAATFARLAPLLPEYRFVALDFPGHGLSDRRHLSAPYYIWSYLTEIRSVVEHFGWGRFVLLGHSMGGAAGCLYAALYPQELSALVLLDILGPLSTPGAKLPGQMREALAELATLKNRQRNYYRDFATAVQARADKGLSLEASRLLGERGIVCDEKGCYWNLDPRLRVLSPMSLSEEQVAAFMQQIRCPVLAVLSTAFWQTRQTMLQQRRLYLPQAQIHELEGGHHQHMEAQAPQVAGLIRQFLAAALPAAT
jgi:pimeloyl-ACP methyl ester carboxylesterase